MLGAPPQASSIGGVFATNISGARRVVSGAARDHLLGIRAVNGQGEIFKSGGRVMKNVTGYDLCRGLSGSWGTLAIMTEVTAKVLPRPEETRTLILQGQPDDIAVEALCAAMGTPFEVSAAVHLQAGLATRLHMESLSSLETSLTALRVENFSSSVAYRAEQLTRRFSPYGELIELDNDDSLAFWQECESFLSSSRARIRFGAFRQSRHLAPVSFRLLRVSAAAMLVMTGRGV